MPVVQFLPDGKTVETEAGDTLLRTALRADIPHAHACGGHARCSTCRVLVLAGAEHCGPRNAGEQRMADRLAFGPELRLACQTVPSADVTLRRLVLDAEDAAMASSAATAAPGLTVGHERRIAILFTDIRGFTPFAESLPAYDVVHILNRYFRSMGHAIANHGGCIDNYMGDGLMALFGVEMPARCTLHAVRAGLDMLAAMGPFNAYLETAYGRSLRIGIGVHFGEAVVGAIGAPGKQKITAIGDAVNVASRVEAANKAAGTQLLISADAHAQVAGQVRIGQHLHQKLPGKSGEHELFEIIGLTGEEA
ncbi:MAG: adenylate/guanylate cyclase domain-containing protein [Gemmataceae bacterium]|nr:adenylate/guanylate cyclase domain-containing protein [Gemmataceae bacterium]